MIGVITYDAPHRKTQDVVSRLILKGYRTRIMLIVIPWMERKQRYPFYHHRPGECVDIYPEQLTKMYDIGCIKRDVSNIERNFAIGLYDHILIAGAGILPDELVRQYKIINSHPGYLPNVRGLDALKWAIYDGQPIGVTTHYINEKPDEGTAIERRMVPVYFEDTFHSVAHRVYETEIEMLVNAIEVINDGDELGENLKDERYVSNMRMPQYKEMIMMRRFEDIRRKSKSYRDYITINKEK